MKNSPHSSLSWHSEDFMSAYLDVCDRLGIKPKQLSVEACNAELNDFFALHNEWIVMTINDALHDWIYEKLLNEKQDQ